MDEPWGKYECPGPTNHMTELQIRWCDACSRWHFRLRSVRSSVDSSSSWSITDEVRGLLERDDLSNHRWRKIVDRAAEQAYEDGRAEWTLGPPRLW